MNRKRQENAPHKARPDTEELARAREHAQLCRVRANTLLRQLNRERLGSKPGLASAFARQYEPFLRAKRGPGAGTLALGRRGAFSGTQPGSPRQESLARVEPVRLIGWTPYTEQETQEVLERLQSRAEAAEAKYQRLKRAVQGAAGALKVEHAPEVLTAIRARLKANPTLTPREFFQAVGEDGDGDLYKSTDDQNREVLKQAADGKSVTFSTVRRYFAKVRRG